MRIKIPPCVKHKCLKYPMCIKKKYIICSDLYNYYIEIYVNIKSNIKPDIANYHSKTQAILWNNIRKNFSEVNEICPEKE